MKRITTFLAIFLFAFVLQGQTVIKNGSIILRAYDANQPLNIEDECKVWLDGKDAGQFTLDGTYVDDWIGKGSLGVHVANTNDNTTRPTYDINTGRVTFTAANSTFLQSAAFGAALAQPNTIFVVYKYTGITTSYVLEGVNNYHAFRVVSGNFDMYTSAAITNGAVNANDNIHVGLFNGASSKYWINGINVVNGDVGVNDLEGVTLASKYNRILYNADCEICEVIVFNADISDVDRDKITAYLSNKWDIPAVVSFKGYVLISGYIGLLILLLLWTRRKKNLK